MKKVFCIIILIILTANLYGDESLSRHSLSLNLGGFRTLGYYEYKYDFIVKGKNTLSASFGLGMSMTNTNFPIGITYIHGTKNQLILGLQFVPKLSSINDFQLAWEYMSTAPFRLGYRRNFRSKLDDYFFQIFISPALKLNSERPYSLNGVGLGFGVYL